MCVCCERFILVQMQFILICRIHVITSRFKAAWTSDVAIGGVGHVPIQPQLRWIMQFVQIRCFTGDGGTSCVSVLGIYN
jgi:hypothetical protein